MKRAINAMTVLLALCVLALSGCTKYDYKEFDLEAADVSNVQRQADGTYVLVSILPRGYRDDEKQLIEWRGPYKIGFAVWGRFERFEKIDAWFVLNGQKIAFPLDPEFEDPRNIRLRSFDGEMYFIGKPDYVLDTPWESIETLQLHTAFTAVVDGETRQYDIVTPFEKKYTEYRASPIWQAMMGV